MRETEALNIIFAIEILLSEISHSLNKPIEILIIKLKEVIKDEE